MKTSYLVSSPLLVALCPLSTCHCQTNKLQEWLQLRMTIPCAMVAAPLAAGGGMGPNKLPDGSFILALPTGNANVSCLAIRPVLSGSLAVGWQWKDPTAPGNASVMQLLCVRPTSQPLGAKLTTPCESNRTGQARHT